MTKPKVVKFPRKKTSHAANFLLNESRFLYDASDRNTVGCFVMTWDKMGRISAALCDGTPRSKIPVTLLPKMVEETVRTIQSRIDTQNLIQEDILGFEE